MTIPGTSLSAQVPAVRALLALAHEFPDLPTPSIAVGPVCEADYAEGLTLTFHNVPAAFEAWREALRLDPAALDLQRVTDFQSLSGMVHLFGVPISLTGYLPLPAEMPDTGSDAA